jgi:hypothetical protein
MNNERDKMLRRIIQEEVRRTLIKEEFSKDEEEEIRRIIRSEISEVFYDLFRRRSFWID